MERRTILIQLDSDPQPSVFDRVVAIDAGADEVFSYGGVQPEQVRDFVHGAIFTRGPKSLKRTALFIGGSNVAKGEVLLEKARRSMLPQFGLQVSICLDANGANTTAAAAVHSAAQHLDLRAAKALVLGATGPVGQRVCRLLARQGAEVRAGSRQRGRAEEVCKSIRAKVPTARLEPAGTGTSEELHQAVLGRTLIVSAGGASALMLPQSARALCNDLRVAIDLNAVPPLGLEGVEVADKAVLREGAFCYGAIGVGNIKMKIHRAAIARLFESNDQVLDAEEVFTLAATL